MDPKWPNIFNILNPQRTEFLKTLNSSSSYVVVIPIYSGNAPRVIVLISNSILFETNTFEDILFLEVFEPVGCNSTSRRALDYIRY